MMATEFPRVDQEASRLNVLQCARELCAGSGIDLRPAGGRCASRETWSAWPAVSGPTWW